MMFHSVIRKTGMLLCITCLLVTGTYGALTSTPSAHAASSVTIDGATKYQTMDGFGFSDAFGPADTIRTLTSATEQKQILDLLMSPSTGAGFTILRNLFPSDAAHTIEPTSPGSPTATPQYTWDGSSWGQIWLAQQAKAYGIKQIYGDAWSAPAFMKTNNDESNGGMLCGTPGATCSTGDWRQAYANYLIQYVKDYQSAGITLSHVGYVNEPNLVTSYSSMLVNPAQAADFAKVLGPTLASSGSKAQIVCCEPEGWDLAQSYASAITSDPVANSYVNVLSSHGYTAAPNSALTGTGNKHIWQTEWSTFDTWDPSWDSGGDASGFTWAQHVYTGITASNLSAFLYWWGVGFNGNDNGVLIHDNSGVVTASKRLWALANYSRFIHPGATRIGASTGDSNLNTTAYKNTDGTTSIVVLNTSYTDTATSFALQGTGTPTGASVVPYITNGTYNTEAQAPLSITSGAFNATIPARSLVTYVVGSTGGTPTPSPTPGTPTPTATPSPTPTPTPSPTPGGSICKVTYSVQSQWAGGFTNSTTITNTGSTSINGWTLTFTFPNGQQVTQIWNGSSSQQGGQVTVKNLSYNGSISPGGSVQFGFNGSWSGTNGNPTSFKLNGSTCS